ncbi:MAG TPA: hypothetical protein VLC92_09575 [Rhodocyclaceae bacterium]|nr:hypothetical protein [Rhodocyclaceae bacterium]
MFIPHRSSNFPPASRHDARIDLAVDILADLVRWSEPIAFVLATLAVSAAAQSVAEMLIGVALK